MAVGPSALARLTPRLALSWVALVAAVWLNQGAADFQADGGVFDALCAPFQFLYRRAVDERLYFAAASATLGEPYDHDALFVRGSTTIGHGDVAVDGRPHVPYAEVPFEYPPPNLPFVLVPRLFASTFKGYARAFGLAMAGLLAGAAWLAARIGARKTRRDDRERDVVLRLGAFGLLLLAHGAIAIQRLDAIIAVLLTLAVYAALRRRSLALGILAGLAGATKVLPALSVRAVAVVAVSGQRRWLRVGAGTAIGALAGLAPDKNCDRQDTIFSYHKR